MKHATLIINVDAFDNARNDVDVNIDDDILNALCNAFNNVELIERDDTQLIVTFTLKE